MPPMVLAKHQLMTIEEYQGATTTGPGAGAQAPAAPFAGLPATTVCSSRTASNRASAIRTARTPCDMTPIATPVASVGTDRIASPLRWSAAELGQHGKRAM